MPALLRYIQYAGFVLTETVCSILLVLILTKTSTKKIGTYKYLMVSFTLFSMVNGVIEVLTQPVFHIEGAAVVLFVDSFLRHDNVFGYHMAAALCSNFGVCVTLLSTHFLYRYLAVCSIAGFVATEICYRPTDLTREYLKEALKLYYDEDVYALAHFTVVYYYYGKNNELVINWIIISTIITLYILMGFAINSIIISAVKTYKSVQGHTKMSQMTRNLHRQLFQTLVLQSLIPFLTMLLPVGLIFFLPFFSVHLGYFANAPCGCISFYPAIDAMVVILMMKDFRRILFCENPKPKGKQTFATSYFQRQSSKLT